MSKTIEANLLEKEVMRYLQNYKENIDEEVEEAANKVGKKATEELKQISPKRSKKKLCEGVEIKERQVR